MTHPVILGCVKQGFLKELHAFDGDGLEVVVYVPTEKGTRYFGPQYSRVEYVLPGKAQPDESSKGVRHE